MNYKVVAGHEVARTADLSDIYAALAEQFHEIRLALNRLSSAIYLMQVKYVGGVYWQAQADADHRPKEQGRPIGPVRGWKPPAKRPS